MLKIGKKAEVRGHFKLKIDVNALLQGYSLCRAFTSAMKLSRSEKLR